MKLEIERSGGFAGISKRVMLDTEKLPKALANMLENYLTKNVESKKKTDDKIKYKLADCYTYKISGQVGTGKVEINFNEFDLTNDLKSAVNYIFKKY